MVHLILCVDIETSYLYLILSFVVFKINITQEPMLYFPFNLWLFFTYSNYTHYEPNLLLYGQQYFRKIVHSVYIQTEAMPISPCQRFLVTLFLFDES
jgi:hypothetical protein